MQYKYLEKYVNMKLLLGRSINMKHEWKKEEKELYLPIKKPHLITIPKFNFILIEGKGDPNTSQEFSAAIGALYSASYTIKMLPKKGIIPQGYEDYVVYPLEGLWDLPENTKEFDKLDKSQFIYKIMIRQPEFVTEELFNDVLKTLKAKSDDEMVNKLKFVSLEDGLCVQMLHIGPFDDEAKSFLLMDEYANENGYKRIGKNHREIYISDFRRAKQENLKTVLRYWVE